MDFAESSRTPVGPQTRLTQPAKQWNFAFTVAVSGAAPLRPLGTYTVKSREKCGLVANTMAAANSMSSLRLPEKLSLATPS